MFDITRFLPGFQEVTSFPVIGVAPVLFVKPNPRRVILYLSNPSAGPLSIWIDPAVGIGSPPHILIPTLTTWRFTWSEDGPMSTYGWLGAYGSGSDVAGVVEILWLPEQLGQSAPGE